nr:hypothetical protein BaRGS_009670 [Batillaria attramentaria]
MDPMAPRDYVWDKTIQSPEDFMTGFGLDTCGNKAWTRSWLTTCYNLGPFPCDCYDNCKLYGSCCYDKYESPEGLTQAWPETTGCLEDKTYAMVRCPQSWGDGDVREACETGQGKYTMEEPVTDLSTNVTFRNAFCAQCHDVKSYTAWELEVTCKHFQDVYTARSEEEFLDLASANVRRWATEDYDADVEKNCLLYKSLSLRMNHEMTYQNLFCAVCNGIKPYTYGCFEDDNLEHREIWIHPPLSLLLGLRDRDMGSGDGHRLVTCFDGQWADLTVST